MREAPSADAPSRIEPGTAEMADRDAMMAELKAEIGRLVVETTAKVSGKVLSDEDQQRLIDETNKELAA